MKGKAELRISICVCIVLICFAVIFFGLSVSPQISGYKSWSSAINHDRFDESRLSDITLGIVLLILSTALWVLCVPALVFSIINLRAHGDAVSQLRVICMFAIVCAVLAGSMISFLSIAEGSGGYWAGKWYNEICMSFALISEISSSVLFGVLLFVKRDWSAKTILIIRIIFFVLIGIALLIIVPTFIPMLWMWVY